MCFGLDALLLALRAEAGGWPCDPSCKCRLYSGIAVSVLLSLVAVVGPVMLWVVEPDWTKTKTEHDALLARNLFIIIYTVGTAGSLAASLIFACIAKQVKQLAHVPHLLSFILWIAIVVVVYCMALKYPKWGLGPGHLECKSVSDKKGLVCHVKHLNTGRIVALVGSILQLAALVLYNVTIVDLVFKHFRQCFPCL
jgi:hypothetical protein